MYGVIRLRSTISTHRKIKDTLKMLRLHRINHCVLIPETPDYRGMLERVKHYVTWGEINENTLEKLVAKRGRLPGDKKVEDPKKTANLILKNNSIKGTGLKPVFRLSPPSKGLKSVKRPYPKGDLGYRGEKINELLERMI